MELSDCCWVGEVLVAIALFSLGISTAAYMLRDVAGSIAYILDGF